MFKSWRMRLEEHAARMEKNNACRVTVWKPEGKIPLVRFRRRCDNIKMDNRE
jgi:hypothetical protein